MTILIDPIIVPAKVPKVVVYLPEELKRDLEALAKAEARSASNMARFLIEEAVEKAKRENRIP